ncbi:MAG: GGDEF domain-containing protein [Pseudomonadota bacterium]
MNIRDVPEALRSARAEGESDASSSAADFAFAGVSEAELTPKVREVLSSLLNEIQTLRNDLAIAHERAVDLEQLADRDPLLDILNRRAFARELDRTVSMADRYETPASLVFLDLNGLKAINDMRGHSAGDAALKHVADVLVAHSRQTDIVGRRGGDEFGLLLTHADKSIALSKADELVSWVAKTPVRWNGEEFPVSVSIGVSEILKGGSADQAMEQADSAMYNAKRSGLVTR